MTTSSGIQNFSQIAYRHQYSNVLSGQTQASEEKQDESFALSATEA
ncbi:MAG: hypothetical protein K2W88_04150 [Pararheinheimera sp.]|nr:hypothetical protein [Rheinheimera sp.]